MYKRQSPAYALGLSFLPLAFLLWSALRFEPILTAGATMLMAFVVVTLIGLGVGGFSTPSGLLETFILLLLLSVIAIVPQLVAAANYRVRAGAFEMLRRARTDRGRAAGCRRLAALPGQLGLSRRPVAGLQQEQVAAGQRLPQLRGPGPAHQHWRAQPVHPGRRVPERRSHGRAGRHLRTGGRLAGVPPLLEDSSAADTARYRVFGRETWATLTRHAAIVLPGGSVVTPSPRLSGASCDRCT